MDVSEALKKRRSVRAYLDKPVDDELLRRILTDAQSAPSNCNTQPWHLSIVSGAARDELEEALVKEITQGGVQAPKFTPGDKALNGIYKERQVECAIAYYNAADIARDDKLGRMKLLLENWRFFGAPHVGFLSMPATMGEVNAVDVGIYLQSLMLLFVENGIASCPQGALAFYPENIKKIASIPEENGILCGISFGYADPDSPINQFQTTRAALEDTVSFVS